MSIKLIASDLDGTFLSKDNKIPLSNLEAINKLEQKEIPFAVCTGKSYSISKAICKECNASYGIFGNGTQIIDLKNNKELLNLPLSIENIEFCYNFCKTNNLHIHAYGTNFIITEKLKYLDLCNYILYSNSSRSSINGKYDKDLNLTLTSVKEPDFSFYIVNNLLTYIKENNLTILNIVISSDKDILKFKNSLSIYDNLSIQYISKKDGYKDSVINKGYEYFSISSSNVGKGKALNFLSDYLNIKKENIMSLGDGLNDIDLLTSSGIGVAVANAYAPIKKVATYVTEKDATNGAFAEAVYKYINY